MSLKGSSIFKLDLKNWAIFRCSSCLEECHLDNSIPIGVWSLIHTSQCIPG